MKPVFHFSSHLKTTIAGVLALTILSTPLFASPSLPTHSELKIGVTTEIDTLNPLVSSSAATSYLEFMVNRAVFTTLNGKNELIPVVMESLPSFKNKQAKWVTTGSSKTVQVTWTIRKEAVWGDGTPITAEDVKFTWQVGLSSNVSTGDKDQYTSIKALDIDPKNPKRFTITLDKPRWDFDRMSTWRILPKHIEGPVFDQWGSQKEGYERNSKYVSAISTPGLYSGPYRVKDYRPGSHVEVVPNEKWWGPQKPAIQKIVYRFISNTATLEANLLSGDIHMVSPSGGFSLDQALAFDKRIQKEGLPYRVVFRESLVFNHLDFNLSQPHFQDVRVRKAIRHAMDLETISKAVAEGKFKVARSFLNPIDPWFSQDPQFLTVYDYNPKKSKQLLEEAGYQLGADGVYQKGGKKLSFTFMSVAGVKLNELILTAFKDQLKKAGIEVQLKFEPGRVFFAETLQKRKFDGLAFFSWISSPENNPRSTLHSTQIPSESNGWSGQNYMGWKNAEADKAIDEIDITFDDAKRKTLIKKVVKAYTAEIPVIPVYYRPNNAAVPANLKGYELMGHQFPDTQNIESWRF